MLISGDVQAIVAIIVFSGLAAWAGGVIAALLFPARTERASLDLEHRVWPTFFVGLAFMLVLVTFAVVLSPLPATRWLAFLIYSGVIGVGVFGTGGLFRLIARRIQDNNGSASNYGAIAKGGALVVAAELLPVFGWFLLFPFVLIASFGAGCKALVRNRARQIEAPPVEAQ
jgi:hypothetical protein